MLKTNFQAFQQCITLITSQKQSNIATGRRSVHIFYFSAFTAIIYCTFDKDYCHWGRNPRNINATQYGFDRHTASDLESSTIPGPPYDAFESKDGTFVIASNMISKDAPKNAIGKLFSPYLLGTQHPVECFSFYVYFSVSYLLQITIVI